MSKAKFTKNTKKINNLTSKILKKNKFELIKVIGEKKKFSTLLVKDIKSSQKRILKVSGNSEGDLLLKNQNFWLKQVNKNLDENINFTIEKSLMLGFTDSRTWLILDYIEGKPYALIENGISVMQVKNPENYFEIICNLLYFLDSIETKSIKNIDKRLGERIKTDKLTLLESAIKFSRNSTPYVADLLQIIEKNYKDLSKSTSQCDITPINLLITKEQKVALVDSELGNLNVFRHYDAAEFFNRLYTRTCKPKLAYKFLTTYSKNINTNQKDKLLSNFLALSALRCLGNFTEINKLPDDVKKKRLKYAEKFAYDIVTYKIVEK
jgi:hypothetical protein